MVFHPARQVDLVDSQAEVSGEGSSDEAELMMVGEDPPPFADQPDPGMYWLFAPFVALL